MKRSIGGGSHRGPVAAGRQRRTLRLVQLLLVVIAAGLLMFAGYAWGKRDGYRNGMRADEIDSPRAPSVAQTVVLSVLGLAALGAAFLIQGPEGIRMPTPARLDELAGRAEDAAVERAEQLSGAPRT